MTQEDFGQLKIVFGSVIRLISFDEWLKGAKLRTGAVLS